ncbi:MAG: Unknown protein [uncultured Sulfurovum sp.]|uniref:Uncharacterized protein n=1 Tax=uncultured Sulfurovum sp. TaxID=269237 RepID=A0A6S6U224_9BACT|nr:MAG: Unknown protein [uncultured Sulfurovum sp.]
MLTVEQFIEKIHKNPQSYFFYTLESIIDSKIVYIKNNLDDKTLININSTLFLEIQETLEVLNKMPTWWHKLLSIFIPLDKHQAHQQKKLNILVDTLNKEIYKINTSIDKNNKALDTINEILSYLINLKEKLATTPNLEQLTINNFLIKEIDDKIILLEGYNVTLSFKKINLLEVKKIYHNVKITNQGLK